MQNDADMRSSTWHPAEKPARQVGRTAGAVVLLNPNSGAEPAPRLQRETKKGVGGKREKRALAKKTRAGEQQIGQRPRE